MNTVLKVNNFTGNFDITEDNDILADTLASLARNNTFCPNITKIQTNNDSMTVSFADGTWTTVKRSKDDAPDNSVALLYSIVKRLMGKPTKGGYIEGCGFMGRIKTLVENIVTPEKIEAEKQARIKAKEDADKKAHEEAVFRRERNPSIGLRLHRLEDKFDKLCDLLTEKNSKTEKKSKWLHFSK